MGASSVDRRFPYTHHKGPPEAALEWMEKAQELLFCELEMTWMEKLGLTAVLLDILVLGIILWFWLD